MKRKILVFIVILICVSTFLTACSVADLLSVIKREQVAKGEAVPPGPVLITGGFEYTNDFVVEKYYMEHAVALLDMTGFVLRDKEWEPSVESQTLGFMDLDAENDRASYRLALPAVPAGAFNDVDQDGKKEQGLQIFAVGYNPNLSGGVFAEGDDRNMGWPGYLASIKTDAENDDEVVGGKLVLWSPDREQEFPSGFGADGLLFTGDDPTIMAPMGYSVVNLDTTPFSFDTDQTIDVTLYEPDDIAIKDFSDLSYTDAFDAFFEVIRKEYAFNGYAGKQPDWDAAYAALSPKIAQAQANKDGYAFYLALRELSLMFQDGHVGVSGGDYDFQFYEESLYGGYGFAVRELDDGSVVAVYVLPDGPADLAGMQVGAQILEFNGDPVGTALDKVAPFEPQSTDFGARYEQSVFLTRGGVGERAEVKFNNPGERAWTEEMRALYEMDSFFEVYQGGAILNAPVFPVEASTFYESIGYIKINSNYDDLGLIVRSFEHALKKFTEAGLFGLIIDMRQNTGGASLGLAGYLHDEEIVMGQLEYYSDKTGQFEADGPVDKVLPNENQYSFEEMVLLVDQFCYSACEIESYGFSQIPGMVVMGQFPTAGVEAETARGEFLLPEGISFGVPTGRFTLPDGSIFLEGEGVQPTIRIPVTAASVLSEEDTVLEAAIDYLFSQ
jgi:C-terminal processing protease CtpA/Prc